MNKIKEYTKRFIEYATDGEKGSIISVCKIIVNSFKAFINAIGEQFSMLVNRNRDEDDK